MLSRAKSFLTVPTFEDEEKTRVARLLNTILLTFSVAVVLVVASVLVLSGAPTTLGGVFILLSGVVMGITVIALLILIRRGRVGIAAFVLLSLLWAIETYWLCGAAGIRSDNSSLLYAFIIALAGLLLGGRLTIVFTLLSVLAVLAAYLAEESGLLVVPATPLTIMDPILTATSLVLIGLLLRYAVSSMTQALERARSNERAQVEANRKLEALQASLEEQVADRTRGLERRSMQLQAAAEVGRVATAILDVDQLMWELSALIQERFGLYHVGLFRLDATGRWAEYCAGAGHAGQLLADEGFRLEVGGPSLVGWCTRQGQARVVQDVGQETLRFDHPLVTETRSEAAIPLVARGQVIGALSVQSDQLGTFDPDTVATLQTMADQLAVALDNARLFAESQEALQAARRAYSELTRQTWTELLRARSDWGYSYTHQSIVTVEGEWLPEMLQAVYTGQSVISPDEREGDDTQGPALALPLKVRDQVVGALGFYKDLQDEVWTAEEIALLETLVSQMGVALESAQLFQETQRRAAREQAIRHVTERMRRAVDVETILQTTVAELARVLGVPRAYVRLGTEAGSLEDPRRAEPSGG